MLHCPQLLLAGGTGRNVGKTEFTCRLIAKIAAAQKIYALKISAMFPDEQIFHGNHEQSLSGLHIFEEHRQDSSKDTSRMLRAGAERVFYLQSEGSRILKGFNKIMENVPAGAPVVCESNTLSDYVRPGLFIMVTSPESAIKERAKVQLAKADLVIVSDGRSGFQELEALHFVKESGWQRF